MNAGYGCTIRSLLRRIVAKGLFLTFATLLTLIISSAALAQTETGQINGTVKDPNGALVGGATVTARSINTGIERTATTAEDGTYSITNLQPGLYDVTVNASGFQPTTQRAEITVGVKLDVDTTLGVTQLQGEQVDVIGSGGVEVNTRDQELSDVVSATQVRELPTVTRDPYDLVSLSGNVSGANSAGRGVGFAINGQREASTSILLDGAENVNTFSATAGQTVPLESVQEFRVITSNFSAEYGRAGGGIVNVATRAGSNDFNGSLFAFNRISRLASNSFDNNANGIPRGVFTRNQFGYAVGGPVLRDRLFFFSSTEWTRVRSTGELLAVVPTPQFLANANVSQNTRNFFSTYGNLTGTPTGTVFTVADIAAERELPAGGVFTSLSSDLPAFQVVSYAVPTDLGAGDPQNTYTTNNRIDFNLSDRTQIYGRFAIEDQVFFPGSEANSPYAGFNTGETNFNQNYLLSVTHTFTPNFVSQTKLAYNRLNNFSPLGEVGFAPVLYFFPNTSGSIGGYDVALPGIYPFNPGTGGPFGGPQNVGQVNQDFNYNVGKNQVRFGGQYVYIQDNRTFGAYSTASEMLGGQGNYEQALDNLVLGQLFQFQAAINPQGQFPGGQITTPVSQPQFTRSNRYNEFALYTNDSIRIHPRVTMNVGLRYEFYGVQRNKNQSLDSNFYFGEGNDIFEQISNGRVLLTQDSPIGQFYRNDVNNFAPRFGLAWDVFGDGRTSLRGGYGVAYERNFGNVTFNVIQNPPNYAVLSLISGVDIEQSDNVITTNNAGPFAGSGVTSPLLRTSLRNLRPDLRNAYVHFYSVAFEREVARNTVASIEYSGSHGRDLYSLENINRVGSALRFLGGQTQDPVLSSSTRLNPQYSNLNTRGNNGFSNYQGLIATLDSSNFRSLGLQFTARYTYSVAKDNLSSAFSETGNTFNLGVTDPFDPRYDYGYADFDARHRFAGSFNYEVPFFNNIENSVLRSVLGGFTLTGIITARSGAPFTIYDCTNSFLICIRAQNTGNLPTRGPDNPPVDVESGIPNRYNYIDLSGVQANPFTDVSGFTEVGPFPTDVTARNQFRAPGIYNIDAGLYKRIRFSEDLSLQLRLEVFNLLNHANLFVSGGEADVSSSSFVPAFRNGRRNVQLAAKFIF